MFSTYTEDALVEQPAIAMLQSLGWEHLDCYEETFGPGGTLGRDTPSDVVLVSRLQSALKKLNPTLPAETFVSAIEELLRDRSLVSPAEANRETYKLLKEGIKVKFRNKDGVDADATVNLIDWNHPENNDFFLASQFWVTGEMYKRRADLIGFINGLPLIFIELKAAHKRLEAAYQNNLRDYKDTIPHLFWYNALIILSNGSATKIGSITSEWEHFNDWKKINRR